MGSSGSNGDAERAIQSLVAQVRVSRSALEAKLYAKIPQCRPIWAWLVEYSALMLNSFEVGNDGRIAYERSKGNASTLLGFEFGEAKGIAVGS